LFDQVKLLTKAFIELLFLLISLVQIARFAQLVPRLQLETLRQVALVSLQSFDLLTEFITILVNSVLLFAHSLSVLGFQLCDHLRVRLLRVALVVKVHLLLELKRLLELLLELFEISFALIALRLQELEAALP